MCQERPHILRHRAIGKQRVLRCAIVANLALQGLYYCRIGCFKRYTYFNN